jgi:hypothetical protein
LFEAGAAPPPSGAAPAPPRPPAELLRDAGEHTVAEAGETEPLAAAFVTYLARWTEGASYVPRPGFDLEAYEYESLGQKLLQLVNTEP